MRIEIDNLRRAARDLAGAASDRPEAARARRLAERLDTGRFLIALVGEFKRGKSTLLNAVLGAQIVPTGALPLTAVATEVAFGEPGVTVEHVDGTRVQVQPVDLAGFVTEDANPGNARGAEGRARVARTRYPLPRPHPGAGRRRPGPGSRSLRRLTPSQPAPLGRGGAGAVFLPTGGDGQPQRAVPPGSEPTAALVRRAATGPFQVPSTARRRVRQTCRAVPVGSDPAYRRGSSPIRGLHAR